MPSNDSGMGQPQNEFSRLIPRDRLGVAVVTEHIVANAQERAALAKRLALQRMDSLEARTDILPGVSEGLLRVVGRFQADVVQSCVVSLEPVVAHVDEAIDLPFTLIALPQDPGEVDIDPEAADWPESVPPEGLDIGELVAQLLSLALEPYPRAPGASLEQALSGTAATTGDATQPKGDNPFRVLEGLKGRLPAKE